MRGISEFHMPVFQCPGTVSEVREGKIVWFPEGRIIPWTSEVEDIEFLPVLKERSRWKSGKSSNADLKELMLRLPELTQQLGEKEALQDLHVVLGSWLIFRDFARGSCSSKELPAFIAPHVVHTFLHGSSPEVRKITEDILGGLFRRHPLLGFPVHSEGHWTLLIMRKVAAGLQIRYYDSLAEVDGSPAKCSSKCRELAAKIVNFLAPEQQLPPKVRNRAKQIDGISCGLYLLHYWEGEVRQFVGEGWSIGIPDQKVIGKLRHRLRQVTKELAEAHATGIEAPKKKAKVDATAEAVATSIAVPEVAQSEKVLESLRSLAQRAGECGAEIWFGCSRCRWGRSGCISCNPEKLAKHMEKFPDKYVLKGGVKELAPQVSKKMTAKELLGEDVEVPKL